MGSFHQQNQQKHTKIKIEWDWIKNPWIDSRKHWPNFTRCVCPNTGGIVLYFSLQFCDFDGCPLLLLTTCRVRKSCLTHDHSTSLGRIMEEVTHGVHVYTYFSLQNCYIKASQNNKPKATPNIFRSAPKTTSRSMSKGFEVPVGHLAHEMESIAVLPMMISECQIWSITTWVVSWTLGFLCRCWENVAILPKCGYQVSLVLALHPYIKLVIGGPGIRSGLDKLSIMYIKTWSCRTLNLVPRSRNANQMQFWIGTNLCTSA